MSARRILLMVALVALALRLAYGLAQDPMLPYANGNDSMWYLANGYTLITNQQPWTDIVVDLSKISVPPVYLIFVGVPEALLSPAAAVIVIRIAQAILSAATCVFAYRLAWRLTDSPRAGLIAAGALALSPAFIIESSVILTETLYVFLAAAGLSAYVEYVARRKEPDAPLLRLLALSVVMFGLATLTRVVLLLFPVGLALHLMMVDGWRVGLRRAGWLLLVCALVVATWTVYTRLRWNRWVIAGEGFAANLYIGATGWNGADQLDQQLEQQNPGFTQTDAQSQERQDAYANSALNLIRSDPVGYLRKRVTELGKAYLQPHGTTAFSGASLRELAASWWREDRSPGGLIALTRADAFWPKLSLYLFHFTALGFGLIGMWMTRRRWRLSLPLIGFIAYTSLVHLVMLALPRYVFPTELCWWVFAAAALDRVIAVVTIRRSTRLRASNTVSV